jgi:hypothetical protein
MNTESLNALGYQHVRAVPNQDTCGLMRMLYTTALVVGLDNTGYSRRYCYESYDDACYALSQWDGSGDPPGPWIKEKPSDRTGPGLLSEAHP